MMRQGRAVKLLVKRLLPVVEQRMASSNREAQQVRCFDVPTILAC